MKKILGLISVLCLSGMVFSAAVCAEVLKLMDFDSGRINEFGASMGSWCKSPADETQGCIESLDTAVKRGETGASLKLEYDVDSPYPAYNGFWMELGGRDLSEYKAIEFWVKGDKQAGYTDRFKVELKDSSGEIGRFLLKGVTGEWGKVTIPFEEFSGLGDLGNMEEFVIVFDDVVASVKEGVIYIDDISLLTEAE